MKLIAFAAATLFAGAAAAHDYSVGDLNIAHPMAFATTPVSRTTGGFFSITNTGETADALIEVQADIPRVELHTTELADGVARMIRQERIEIGPGETVRLERGGYHVMFMGLSEPLEEGTALPATLVFEKAGPVEIEFNIEARDGAATDHDDHPSN